MSDVYEDTFGYQIHQPPHGDEEPIAARELGLRRFARGVSGTVSEVAATGVPVVLTRHGQPVAMLVRVDPDPAPPGGYSA
jgi:hypothetical protein